MALTDLYDDRRAPRSRWTRVNIGEAIPGVPTPLTWSVWRPAMEQGFWWSQVQLGVAAAGEAGRVPVTTIALGHPAISVDVTVEHVGRLPGYDPDAFAEQYFGFAPGDGPSSRSTTSWTTLARVARRAPVALATLGRRVAANAARSEAAWHRAVHGGAPVEPLALLTDARRQFIDAMKVHTLAGVVCQGAYERVTALAPDLAPWLLSSDGSLEEARLADDLWQVAHGRADEGAFLRHHGFHGPDESELAAPSWREDPTQVRSTMAAWTSTAADRSPAAAAARRAAERQAAEDDLLRRVSRHRRADTRTLLRVARRLVAHRETGKAAFLRHLDVARFAARALGDDAVWCTYEELRDGARPDAAERTRRETRRAELAAVALPLSFVGDPVPLDAPVPSRPGPTTVTGIGASPGVAHGFARVVTDPAALQTPIGPDEVLVAHTTDPSWVTLFLTAGALVIDVGGALSHGAIIARELGIPCVIGTGDGTTRIRDGARCTVDGTTGTVTTNT